MCKGLPPDNSASVRDTKLRSGKTCQDLMHNESDDEGSAKPQLSWCLGLNLGSQYLGWAAVSLLEPAQPDQILDIGTRIFSDAREPQSRESKAATRRLLRGQRRNRDRYLQRRSAFLRVLTQSGLLPQSKEARKLLQKLDPWVLRARALREPLALEEIGRALFHLQQRRGFQYNRLSIEQNDDQGAIAGGAASAQRMMCDEAAATLGELKGLPRQLVRAENELEPAGHRAPLPRARVLIDKTGGKTTFDYYPLRSMVADEFDAIWNAQAVHYPETMTDLARDKLRKILLFQRPLKPQLVGRCLFHADEECAPSALPSAQRLRIYRQLNELRLAHHAGEPLRQLTSEERDTLAVLLLSKPKLSLIATRKILNLGRSASFNIEARGQKFLVGDTTFDTLTANRKTGTGNWEGWATLSLGQQDALVEILLGRPASASQTLAYVVATQQMVTERVAKALEIEIEEARSLLEAEDCGPVSDFLQVRYGLEPATAARIAGLRLAYGHERLGRTACHEVLHCLMETNEMDRLRDYHSAALAAGYVHPDPNSDEKARAHLPYYGEVLEDSVAFGSGDPQHDDEQRFGKLSNPTVHVALNQLRKVVNALIVRFGKPSCINLRISRDLPLGAAGRKRLDNLRREARVRNLKLTQTLTDLGKAETHCNRLKLRLWEEAEKAGSRCPLTGECLRQEMLWSGELNISYILPYLRTLDDGFNNKALVLRDAHDRKSHLTPWEAVEKGIFPKAVVAQSSQVLPPAKAWRFAPDAMQRLTKGSANFLDLQLRDRRHVAKLIAAYLESLGSDVRTVNDRLTAALRKHWKLDKILAVSEPQSRQGQAGGAKHYFNDHRRRAIDAFVIAMSDGRITRAAAARSNDDGMPGAIARDNPQTLLASIAEPFDNYLEQLEKAVSAIVVSHKPDHGLGGPLHEDTNYGIIQTQSGERRLATRKVLATLSPGEVRNIGDDRIRREVIALTEGLSEKDRKQALLDYCERTGHKRVRVHKPQAIYETIEHFSDGMAERHTRSVIPRDNYCMDIVETPEGDWHSFAVSRFLTHKHSAKDRWKELWRERFPDCRLVMRVHNGDLMLLERDGVETVMRVIQLRAAKGLLTLASAKEAGNLDNRHMDPSDPFRWDFAQVNKLKSRKARLVRVTPDGILCDPRPPL